MKYFDYSSISPIQIPSDSYNITHEKLHEMDVYVIKEDDQFKATFLDENIQYYFLTHEMDYDISQRILESMFQT